MLKKFAIVGVLIFIFSLVIKASARENVVDWYIQKFETVIVVNKDSSLEVTERIKADCGNAPDKHGIFRILPEKINIDGKNIPTPVELISIKDFNGNYINYVQSRDRKDQTIIWKIGDSNKTVSGVNNYEIRYRVKNAIRFNENFDEFYWNLSGNYWDLEIDKFYAEIIFPEEIGQDNSSLSYYAGFIGGKEHDAVIYSWTGKNLVFETTRTLRAGEGVTASVTFPKNIFAPYSPSFMEKYGRFFWFVIPIIVFLSCFNIWKKHGRDPKVKKTIIPEYDIPNNLSPLEMGGLMKSGGFYNEFITAEIINLAVKGLLKIKESSTKILFFNSKDFILEKTNDPNFHEKLTGAQKEILAALFSAGNSVTLSSLRNNFYKSLPAIKGQVNSSLSSKNLLVSKGNTNKNIFIIIGVLLFFPAFIFFSFSVYFFSSLFISASLMIIFGIFMPKRTQEGAELNWQIKGFKLFMETVDKDRAKFYENENMFEKFLPYAILFGITGLWIKKMKDIYGEEFYSRYAPAWYAGSIGSFNADSLSSTISSLSSSIASGTSSPSGSGGGGSSGGGGGGGGGGGW